MRIVKSVVYIISSIIMSFMMMTVNVMASEPSQQRQQELLYLLRQDCGSCHGLLLKGGLGPALLPENLTGKSEQVLTAIILYGRPEKAMPPWKDILSESEVLWLVRQLKNGVVDEKP